MAAIVPIPSQNFRQQSVPQQPAPTTQDPLFEALVKYITSGPGPSNVTSVQIEDIINDHVNQPGGREYLQSIVAPVEESQIKLWTNHSAATGFISTNMTQLTVNFTATRNKIFQKLEFKGNCSGFFPPGVFTFDRDMFFWDEITNDMSVKMRLRSLDNLSMIIIQFFTDENPPIGELMLDRTTLRLPPSDILGIGKFKLPEGPQ